MNPGNAAELANHCYTPHAIQVPEGCEILINSDIALKDNRVFVDPAPEFPVPVSPVEVKAAF